MSSTVVDIDLNKVRSSPDARIYSGRDSGEAARKRLEVGQLDQSPQHVRVHIPDDIYAINMSFFLGLFGQSVRYFGERGFRDKYEFFGKEVHNNSINEGIKRALLEGSIFDALPEK